MRISYALALMVAGVLAAAGIASAQSTTTEPLSDYTSTTPTVTTPTGTTPTQTTQGTQTQQSAPSGAGEVGSEQQSNAVAPSVAAQPAGNAPSQLAFTGAEPLLLIALGLGLAGGTAFLLVRERRRS